MNDKLTASNFSPYVDEELTVNILAALVYPYAHTTEPPSY